MSSQMRSGARTGSCVGRLSITGNSPRAFVSNALDVPLNTSSAEVQSFHDLDTEAVSGRHCGEHEDSVQEVLNDRVGWCSLIFEALRTCWKASGVSIDEKPEVKNVGQWCGHGGGRPRQRLCSR